MEFLYKFASVVLLICMECIKILKPCHKRYISLWFRVNSNPSGDSRQNINIGFISASSHNSYNIILFNFRHNNTTFSLLSNWKLHYVYLMTSVSLTRLSYDIVCCGTGQVAWPCNTSKWHLKHYPNIPLSGEIK